MAVRWRRCQVAGGSSANRIGINRLQRWRRDFRFALADTGMPVAQASGHANASFALSENTS
jgi:hypothetical protein